MKTSRRVRPRKERERVVAQKEKEKEAETSERNRRVVADALDGNFPGQMSAYKKDDHRALAWALGLSDKGTDNELTVQTEEAFKTHLGLQKNSRFSGLFQRAPGRNPTRVAEPNQGAVLRKVTSYPDIHLPANEEAQH